MKKFNSDTAKTGTIVKVMFPSVLVVCRPPETVQSVVDFIISSNLSQTRWQYILVKNITCCRETREMKINICFDSQRLCVPM